jgi:hypothetical protein
LNKRIFDNVTAAIEELTKVQFALRLGFSGRPAESMESIYKRLVNAQDEVETARIEMSRQMVRHSIQPQEVAD